MSQSKANLLQNARMLLAAHEELKDHFYGMMQVLYAIAARHEGPLTVSEFELNALPDDGKIRIHHDVDTSLFTIIPFRPEQEQPAEVVEAAYETGDDVPDDVKEHAAECIAAEQAEATKE